MYSLFRKSVASLRELFAMKTALRRAPAQKQTQKQRKTGEPATVSPFSSPKTIEKLDMELDFANGSLPAKTSMTHPHVLFAPMHYEPKYAYPLLVWLHGTGGDERQIMRIMPLISMQNYVAVAPRGLPTGQAGQPTGRAGQPTGRADCSATFDLSVSAILQRRKEQYDWLLSSDNLATLEQRVFDCIAIAGARCNIAAHRVFIAGFGTGGTAALRLATLFPEHFAGAASFGGGTPPGNRIFPSWQLTRSLSILLGVDEVVPDYACRMMELFYTAGIAADVREYADTKSLTPAMLQDLNRWMMQIVCQPAEMASAIRL